MEIFEFAAYQDFLRAWLNSQPKKGRGLLRAWAEKYSVHPSLLSQILSGKRLLTAELADALSEEMLLSETESEFLQLLVRLEQAGTHRLKSKIQKKIEEARTKAKTISARVKPDAAISDEQKSEFYSSWIYSAVRNLTAIPKLQNSAAIAQRLNLPRSHVDRIVSFLIEAGLCKTENGQLKVGSQKTYLSTDSHLVLQHHQNWRLQAISKMPLRQEDNLFLTIPMSLSASDAEKIKNRIPSWFEEIQKIVGPSNSETARCLNIDFFEF